MTVDAITFCALLASVGTQLQSFATHSPIGFLLDWLALPGLVDDHGLQS